MTFEQKILLTKTITAREGEHFYSFLRELEENCNCEHRIDEMIPDI